MDANIIRTYNKLIEDDIDIIDLYIYHCVATNENTFCLSDGEILKLCKQIRYNYNNDAYSRGVDVHINAILYDTDIIEDEEDYW